MTIRSQQSFRGPRDGVFAYSFSGNLISLQPFQVEILKLKKLSMIAGGPVLMGLFFLWYDVAANFDYNSLSGTYTYENNVEAASLFLNPDQTFVERLNRSGHIQEVKGHWRRYGEAHASFSSEFLLLQGQEPNASGEAHGEFDKTLGLFPKLILAPLPNGPTLRRKLFN